MLGYFIAFIICMALFIYFMYDGTLFKHKKAVDSETVGKTVIEDVNNTPLNAYLREHVYKHLTFEFKQLQDSKNGYYYEKGVFSLTVFDYPTYRTAQLFQVKPYQQIAVMHVNKSSFEQADITFKEVPESSQALIRSYFGKIKDMNLHNLHNTLVDAEIETIYERLQTQIKKMNAEQDLLSTELKRKLKQMITIELPELMQQYQHLPMYDLQTGKTRIKERLQVMEQELTGQWEHLLEEKRKDYERIVSLTK